MLSGIHRRVIASGKATKQSPPYHLRKKRSPVAISFLFLQELGYSNGKKEKDKNPEVHDEGDRKNLQKIAGKKKKKKNNSLIHA
ncbi:MAG TPA: hypothetical protein VGA95_02825 [Thermodesulfobacteriota bacterium]